MSLLEQKGLIGDDKIKELLPTKHKMSLSYFHRNRSKTKKGNKVCSIFFLILSKIVARLPAVPSKSAGPLVLVTQLKPKSRGVNGLRD